MAHSFRMLIADDDAVFRETLRTIFEPRFETLEAASGEEAIEIAEAEPLDIALLDMHMHVLTGLETLKVLKSFNWLMPCMLITADATVNSATTAEIAATRRDPNLRSFRIPQLLRIGGYRCHQNERYRRSSNGYKQKFT